MVRFGGKTPWLESSIGHAPPRAINITVVNVAAALLYKDGLISPVSFLRRWVSCLRLPLSYKALCTSHIASLIVVRLFRLIHHV